MLAPEAGFAISVGKEIEYLAVWGPDRAIVVATSTVENRMGLPERYMILFPSGAQL